MGEGAGSLAGRARRRVSSQYPPSSGATRGLVPLDGGLEKNKLGGHVVNLYHSGRAKWAGGLARTTSSQPAAAPVLGSVLFIHFPFQLECVLSALQ